MKRLLFALLFSVTGAAFADGIEITCDGSPAGAALTVPRPADRFLHVLCTKFGHVLAPTAGWFWTPPGTYQPLFYPAQMVQTNPAETGNNIYFTAITATSLSGKAARDKWELLAGLFPDDAPPEQALEIVGDNNSGGRHTLYIFPNAWGYSCSPTCRKENAFIMISQAKEHPQW